MIWVAKHLYKQKKTMLVLEGLKNNKKIISVFNFSDN